MNKKILIAIASLALSLTGFTPARGYLVSSTKQVADTEDQAAAEAAARHCRCQSRHWRAHIMHR